MKHDLFLKGSVALRPQKGALDTSVRMGVNVWDLPTRLFHWALTACVTGAVITAQIGGNWMDWHLRLGLATIALLAFRLVWGVMGPRYARFSNFFHSPKAVWQYLRRIRSSTRHAGHSPSGGAAVLTLLLLLVIQASTGLLSSDSISVEGPLAAQASEAVVSWATWLHVKFQWVIYFFVALHVVAVLAYLVFKKDNLVTPMLTGRKVGIQEPAAADSWQVRLAGALLFSAVTGAVFWWLQ